MSADKLYYSEVDQYLFRVARPYIYNLDFLPILLKWDGVNERGNKYFETHHLFIEGMPPLGGVLIAKADYTWDGCSRPAINTKKNKRGGLAHDLLCQLIRLGVLSVKQLPQINLYFKKILKEDGFMFPTAYYLGGSIGARLFGIKPDPKETAILEAP